MADSMYDALKEIQDNDRVGDFLIPAMPEKVKGRVAYLSEQLVVIETASNAETFQFIAHPDNVVVVQRKGG